MEQSRKTHIRGQLKEKRESLTKVICDDVAKKVHLQLKEQPLIQERGYIYGYYPKGKELSVLPFLQWALEAGKRVALPKVSGQTMNFYEVTSLDEVVEGAYGIMEPISEKTVCWEEAVCLIPGLGFDMAGHRIGYGAGYYDRYLSEHSRLKRVGVTYEQQIVEEIPTEETDISMEYIATEDRWMEL